MGKTSLYIDSEAKQQVKAIAKETGRTIAQTLRELVALWRATSAVERAYILSGEGWRPNGQEKAG